MPSLRAIAKEMGVSAPYLSRMRGGKRPWRADLLEKYNQLVNTVANLDEDEELDRRHGVYRCLDCGQAWVLNIRPGGRTPEGWWKCPNGCNMGEPEPIMIISTN